MFANGCHIQNGWGWSTWKGFCLAIYSSHPRRGREMERLSGQLLMAARISRFCLSLDRPYRQYRRGLAPRRHHGAFPKRGWVGTRAPVFRPDLRQSSPSRAILLDTMQGHSAHSSFPWFTWPRPQWEQPYQLGPMRFACSVDLAEKYSTSLPPRHSYSMLNIEMRDKEFSCES